MSRYGYIAFNIFQVCSTSLFTGGTFYSNLNNFHEYLIQHSLKSGGTKDHITSNVKSIDVWRSNVVNMLQTTHLDLLYFSFRWFPLNSFHYQYNDYYHFYGLLVCHIFEILSYTHVPIFFLCVCFSSNNICWFLYLSEQ